MEPAWVEVQISCCGRQMQCAPARPVPQTERMHIIFVLPLCNNHVSCTQRRPLLAHCTHAATAHRRAAVRRPAGRPASDPFRRACARLAGGAIPSCGAEGHHHMHALARTAVARHMREYTSAKKGPGVLWSRLAGGVLLASTATHERGLAGAEVRVCDLRPMHSQSHDAPACDLSTADGATCDKQPERHHYILGAPVRRHRSALGLVRCFVLRSPAGSGED
jgi:hypothetical protein